MKKLWIIVVAVMVSAFALTGCGGSAGAKSVESAQSAASSSAAEPAPSSETPAPTADEKAAITIQDDKNGVAVQEVSIGKRDYVAEITVPFRYEQQYGKAVVTEIGKATAKNVAGWFRVNQDASEGTKQVGSGNGGTKAVVYVAYEASIGQGWQTYDDLIEIDLRNI